MNPSPRSDFAELIHETRLICRQGVQVWSLVPRHYKLSLFGAGLLMAAVSGCNTALPLLLGDLVDRVRIEVAEGTAGFVTGSAGIYLLLIALAYLLREILQVARRAFVENTATHIEKEVTTRLFDHLMNLEMSALSQERIGALQGRIGRSVVGFVRFIRLGFLEFFPPLLTGLFALIAALTRQPILALVMLGVIPLSLFLTIRQLLSQKGVRLRLIRSREEMDGAVVELLGGLDYVRAANTQHLELARVAGAAEARRLLERDHHWKMSLFGCGKALNEGFFHVVVLTVAIYLALQGQISLGDVLTFSMLFLNVMAPLNEVHRLLDEGHECSLLVADLFSLLEQKPDRSFTAEQTSIPHIMTGAPLVRTRGLVVEYPTSNGMKKVLDGVNVEIRHGETIGLAGPSGCGKTTWLRVVLRLAHPTEGEADLGGVPLGSVSRAEIGRLFGYVGQSPFVFSGTIADNIAYGNRYASLEDIEMAARVAQLHDEIIAMPGGYSARVLERGTNLSGGQRQRLALARIFLKNPAVLILDEGTSALDTISERLVQRAIELGAQERTTILVAHRLTTLQYADRILVFQHGRVVETGSYSELYQQGGVFTKLVDAAEASPVATARAQRH